MHITITPTPHLTTVQGQECRLWEGVTDQGTPCQVYVTLVGVREDEDPAVFAALSRELQALPTPAEAVVPLWRLSPGREAGRRPHAGPGGGRRA